MKYSGVSIFFFIIFFVSAICLAAQNPCDNDDIEGFLHKREIDVILNKKVKEMMRTYCFFTGDNANYYINSCNQFSDCDIPDKKLPLCTVMDVTFSWNGQTCWTVGSYSLFRLTALIYFEKTKIVYIPDKYISRNDSFDRAEACSEITKSIIETLLDDNK